MSKIKIERTDELLVGNAGIVAVGELLRIADFRFANTIDANESQNKISTEDIIKVAIALLCVGKCGFEYIKEFDNEFIKGALEVTQIASPATFRQRLEKICDDPKLLEELRLATIRLIRKCEIKPILSSSGTNTWIRVDTDTSVFDNSDTKKEGVAYGYNKVEGFAPKFSFLPGGIIIGSELLPGNFHATHKGHIEYISNTNNTLSKIYPHNKYLWCYDAGFDNKELIDYHIKNKHDFIVRYNIKNRPIKFLIEHAKDSSSNSILVKQNRDMTVYRGSIDLEYGINTVKLVYELSLLHSKDDQGLLCERPIQFSVLTNIKDVSDEEILRLYRERATCEQYISELKSDLDLERLPSGKFDVNKLYFQLGVFANNILRIIGESLIQKSFVKLRKATRRRIRTIIHGIMYMCGKLVHHARNVILKIVDNFGYSDALIYDIERFRRL